LLLQRLGLSGKRWPHELRVCTSSKSFRVRGPSLLVHAAMAVGCALLSHAVARAEDATVRDGRARALQELVDTLRDRMGIVAPVEVTVVERDARALSVRRNPAAAGQFSLSAERGFLGALTTDQVEAALAHELGHVWIYTHHPYLQTEQLANRVAMRVVSRDRLVEVYRALWGDDAVHGSLETFLGVEAAGK
jgi:hypothetical protein